MDPHPLYACFVCGIDIDWYGECDACVAQRELAERAATQSLFDLTVALSLAEAARLRRPALLLEKE